MALRRRWASWRALPIRMRRLVLEAAAALLGSRLLVEFGLRWSMPWFLRQPSPDARVPPVQLLRDVHRAVRIAAHAVPWSSVCLPDAMAAKLMLQRRGYASTLHLGVGRLPARDLHAHAWLEAGGSIVAGNHGIDSVVALPVQPARARPS